MIKTQMAQIAATLPISNSRKILGKPETSLESVKMVSMKFSKPLRQVNNDYLLDPPQDGNGYPKPEYPMGFTR